MAAKKQAVEVVEQETTDVAVFTVANPLLVLTEPAEFDKFYDDVKARSFQEPVDLTTATGRKAVASAAYKVSRTKTAIEAAAKQLTADARAQIAKVNESRDAISERLDKLRDEVRAPLTQWEREEEARTVAIDAIMADFRAAPNVPMGESADAVAERIARVRAVELDENVLREFMPIAEGLRFQATLALEKIHAALVIAESERAELERLREAEAERQRLAEIERQEREAEETREREAAETKRLQDEAEERERNEAEAERLRQEAATAAEAQRVADAAEAARVAEANKAAAEQAERDAAHKAEVEAANKRAHEAEERAANERREREEAEAERKRVAAEQEAEDARRAKDRVHKAKIMGAAKAALMESCDLDEPKARAIVLAIAGDNIPAVKIEF